MQFGFGKVDITPRIGVGLYGYGPYLCRFSTSVRDRLYARALAVADGPRRIVLVSTDLVGVAGCLTREVRERVGRQTGLPPDAVMVHATHTHCGPRTKDGIGQGMLDDPYWEILPVRIAHACVQALERLTDATLCRAVVPAEGIGYSREYEKDPDPVEAMKETYRPAKPELTDTRAQVFRVDGADGPMGFFSYFSCHPVIGRSGCRAIHGDFCGVATNLLERERPGSIGLYLQGAHGNINACVVYPTETESLLALDVIAARYARSVRAGLREAQPVTGTGIAQLRKTYRLKHQPLPLDALRGVLAQNEAIVKRPDASDADYAVRHATVRLIAIRREIARQEAGLPFDESVELQGFRIGDIVVLGAPFELAHGFKRRVQESAGDKTLILSQVNDALGYAPEREAFAQANNYAAWSTPYMLGYPPFSPDVEDELVAAFLEMDGLLRHNHP